MNLFGFLNGRVGMRGGGVKKERGRKVVERIVRCNLPEQLIPLPVVEIRLVVEVQRTGQM